MSRAPKRAAAYALRAESTAPKPSPNTTMPTANTHSAGARASAARAAAASAVPTASTGPQRARDRMRPVATLETTLAATPKASKIPSAPTGTPRLSRIEGHSWPRVEPGSAMNR